MAVTIIGKRKTVLGVDPSTKTGVTLMSSLSVKNKNPKSELLSATGKTGMARAMSIAADLGSLLSETKPDLVVIEGYGYGNAHTLATLVEIGTMLRYTVIQYDVPLVVVPPTMLKKFLTGKGNAKKEVMLLELYKRYGISMPTNDEADAAALALMGLAGLGEIQVTAGMKAVTDKVEWPLKTT